MGTGALANSTRDTLIPSAVSSCKVAMMRGCFILGIDYLRDGFFGLACPTRAATSDNSVSTRFMTAPWAAA